MPITSLLEGTTFDPNEVAIIVAAFEELLSRLEIRRGSNPARERRIAQNIIAAASSGPFDQRHLVRTALAKLNE